jgi:threonine/homoserine efflux transporter RhtA
MMPLVDRVWIALIFAQLTNKPISEFLTLEAKEGAQMLAAVIGAAIWIPYILRSRRVANTFTQ